MRLLLLATLALVCTAALIAQQPPPAQAPEPIPALALPLDRSTRLLVVAPHPDDEALGAAGLMQRVHAKGGDVRVVMMTSGDGFPEGVEVAEGIAHPSPADLRGYGELRERETREAMSRLGVASDHVTFLGFPDEGLCQIASTYLFDRRRAFESPYTQRESPPPSERMVRGIKYRGVDVRRELERILTTFAPTLLVLPHPEDEHPDHCATHIFVTEALNALPRSARQRMRVLHYVVHFGQWPLTAEGGLGSTLHPPNSLPRGGGRWLSLALTPEETDGKKRALLTYQSQILMIGRFMLSFGRSNELFVEGEPSTMPACWCDGENIAGEAPLRPGRGRP